MELSPNIASSSKRSSELQTMSSNKSSTSLSVDLVEKVESAGEGLTLQATSDIGVVFAVSSLLS